MKLPFVSDTLFQQNSNVLQVVKAWMRESLLFKLYNKV